MKKQQKSGRGLTPRQEVFAQRLAVGDSQGQAYREAGFAAQGDRVYELASRLAKQVKVRSRVDQLRLQLDRARASTRVVTAHTVSVMLEEVAANATRDKQHGAAATAIMGLAKLHGLLVDKTEDVTRRAARSPNAPVEIEVEHWLTEQGVAIEHQPPIEATAITLKSPLQRCALTRCRAPRRWRATTACPSCPH